MHRVLLFGSLVTVLLVFTLAAAAAAQTTPGVTTTTVAETVTGGTSPWVLVLVGAALGGLVGVFTGLARRRRAERQSDGR